MLIRYARPEDKTALKNIWQQCFSDSVKFVEWNFENNFACENAMLCEENGRAVSNLHLIPYDVVLKGEALKGVYISAVATVKECRKKGYASRLIEAALRELSKKGADIAFLVPAIEGYYERFGFVKIADKACETKKCPAGYTEETKIPDAGEVLNIYLEANSGKSFYLKRRLKDTALILEDLTENTKGECRMLADGSAYAMYKICENKVKVFELKGRTKAAEKRMLCFLYSYGKRLEFELPAVMVKPLNKKIKAEELLLPRKDMYFNLIL